MTSGVISIIQVFISVINWESRITYVEWLTYSLQPWSILIKLEFFFWLLCPECGSNMLLRNYVGNYPPDDKASHVRRLNLHQHFKPTAKANLWPYVCVVLNNTDSVCIQEYFWHKLYNTASFLGPLFSSPVSRLPFSRVVCNSLKLALALKTSGVKYTRYLANVVCCWLLFLFSLLALCPHYAPRIVMRIKFCTCKIKLSSETCRCSKNVTVRGHFDGPHPATDTFPAQRIHDEHTYLWIQ